MMEQNSINQNFTQIAKPVASYFQQRNLLKYKKPFFLFLVVVFAILIVKNLFVQKATITVIGTGSLSIKPAKVEMTVAVVDSNLDSTTAIDNGEKSVQALIDTSKNLLGAPDIQRAFYQITPTVVGGDKYYQVANVFKITSDQPTKTSELIKNLYISGATTITNISFLPAEQADVTQDARQKAMKNAKDQAKKIAKAAGKRVGRIVAITDDLSEVSGTVAATEGSDNANVGINFVNAAPETIEVNKVVSVTYEIW